MRELQRAHGLAKKLEFWMRQELERSLVGGFDPHSPGPDTRASPEEPICRHWNLERHTRVSVDLTIAHEGDGQDRLDAASITDLLQTMPTSKNVKKGLYPAAEKLLVKLRDLSGVTDHARASEDLR